MNSRLRPSRGPILPILACAAMAASPAHGATLIGLLPASLAMQAHLPASVPCATPERAAAPDALQVSKASALLGGAPSRLQMILQQQAAAQSAATATSASPVQVSMPIAATALLPAAAAATPACASAYPTGSTALVIAAPATITPAPAARPAIPGAFLSSARLPVSRTAFDVQWSRVSRAALGAGAVRRLGLPAHHGAPFAQRLQAINTWANSRIRYAEDRTLYGQADYWADARETLRRGAGDCEDIAIVKMQLLAASGVAPTDMFLTVARDLARRADHALLVVRDGERYWLLDNATNVLVDAGTAQDYAPVFSFSQQGKWLHGMPAAATTTIAAAVTPVPAPLPAATVTLAALSPALSAR